MSGRAGSASGSVQDTVSSLGGRKVIDFQRYIDPAERPFFSGRNWTVLVGTHREAGVSVGLPTLQPCEVLLLTAGE